MTQILTLHVGLDPVLLQTRSQVLTKGGYIVVSAFSVAEAAKKFRAHDFDLVILCHSISTNERRLLTEWIHGHSPLTPVVLISKTELGRDAGMDFMIDNNPERLLEGLPRVLHECRELLEQGRKLV